MNSTQINFQKANSPDEILDLVNENDEVIGEVKRVEANSDPKLIHREVGTILVDISHRILLQKRSLYKTVNPGVWSICAGHVEKGENPDEVAHKELQEEYGFDTPLTFLRKELHRYPHETHFMYLYLGNYQEETIRIEPSEIEKVAFFSQEEFKELVRSDEAVNEHYFDVIRGVWSSPLQKNKD